MPYYVYIVLCQDGSYYTGYSNDVEKRFERHKKGSGARYTKLHKPEEIVYTRKFKSRREAMKKEREIKSLSHSQKEQLIKSHENPKEG